MTSEKIKPQLSISSSSNSSLDDDLPPEGIDTPPVSPVKSKSPTPCFQPRRKRRTVYTAGRPPWYDSHGHSIGKAFVIGLAGGSASGKTTVATRIIESLGVPWISVLSMDSFYKVLGPEENKLAAANEYNFDHPDALDFDLMVDMLRKLKEGKHVEVPVYDFSTHSRAKYTKPMYGANVIIFEGILSFTDKTLREMMDMKVFVDTDPDVRLIRRLRRDIQERGRDLDGVLKQYFKFVKPAFEQFIGPCMQYADIVVPYDSTNEVAINLIVQHVKDMLVKRGVNIRSELHLANHSSSKVPASFHLLKQTNQIKLMHTIIRDRNTGRDEFVFYTNRLACLLVEYALSFFPYQDTMVTMPSGNQYQGKRYMGKLCAVTILRAGEVLEPALRLVCKDVKYGKMLIQTNEEKEPQLHFVRLPSNLHEHHVILCEATVATGAAAIMAIRVLLDHDVPEENIVLVSIIAANPGVHAVAYAFPKVKIISTGLDEKVNDQYHILPGVGNFGDRYFGTDSSF